jgi:TolB-like protein/Tfp pilus assembly protein PilF
MSERNFFAELKRRNVYKVAVAYIVAGWALSQGIAQVFPVFDIPNWIIRSTVVLIIIGLPIALVLAWMFELTPQGIKRTETADAMPAATRKKKHLWIYVIVIGVLMSIGLFLLGRYSAVNGAPRQDASAARTEAATVPDKSIAVLPFDNLSRDPDNAYFAEGVQDEILTRLAKIGDLKVISRTSTQHFKSTPENLPEIAKQLGVANILEGSVQKANEQVRVNVQLINAMTDAHLWAETYDRKLTDIFTVESDIAKNIAETLQAKLSSSEKSSIAKQPTVNPEAYELYLKGRFFWNKRTPESLNQAVDAFNQAIARDPNYADAYVGLADCYNLLREFSILPANEAYFKAFAAAKKAAELDPQSSEAHASLAFVTFWGMWDMPAAEVEFRRAIELNRNNVKAHHWFATFLQAISRSDEASTEIEVARKLDPHSSAIIADQGEILRVSGHREEALQVLKQLEAAEPDFVLPHRYLRFLYFDQLDYPNYLAELKKEAILTHDTAKQSEAEAAAKGFAEGGAQGMLAAQLAKQKELYQQGKASPYAVAQTEARLGNSEEMLKYLTLCVQSHNEYALDLGTDESFNSFHRDPAFQRLVTQIGLPPMRQ